MMNVRKMVILGVLSALVALAHGVFAQDDLDDLLKALDEGAAKPAAAAPAKAEAKAEESVEAVKAEPAKAEEKVEEAKAEEKPEESKVEKSEAKATEVAEDKSEEKAEAKPAAPANPDAELISNLSATEKLRRLALDEQAKREIVEARAAMNDTEYTEAVRHYGLAAKLLNDRPASKMLRKECDQGIAEGLYRAAMQEEELGHRDRAQRLMEKALDMRHPKARRVLEKWAMNEPEVEKKEVFVNSHRQNEEDYQKEREQIRKHLRRGRQYLALRDMKEALKEVEIVLKNDPYNQEAIRLRNSIQKKRLVILKQEREASREGMIADVDEAWRPVYAVNAAQLTEANAETIKKQAGEDPERTLEQDIERRMKEMRLPTISFKPPATIIDAVEFFRQASKDYDRPDIPIEKRGFNFVLRTPQGAIKTQAAKEGEDSDDFSSNGNEGDASQPSNGLEPIQTITASDITFHEALKLVCDSVGYKFIVRGPVVMVMPQDMSTAEILSRKYNVPEAFMERVNSASEEVKSMGGFGGSNSSKKSSNSDEEESPDRDWKAFFEEMGVKWPEGSSIKHVKALGKLYVRNTRENLAEFEKVLDELGGQPMLIEIETRFVEVSQEDLNSLGFEWLLNEPLNFSQNYELSKIFGTQKLLSADANVGTADATTASTAGSATSILSDGTTTGGSGGTMSGSSSSSTTSTLADRGSLTMDGSTYATGNRYLSTTGNHISGSGNSTNDKFMRVNAFLGNANLSMILHMLSQRSDTDLLSAPKIVTKSGENAVIKVVTEYIYPQDYDVQLQSSSSSGSGSSSGGSSSCILAVVEPQNFTMREVGVILDVTPTYSEANGGTIDLELKPQVVDEPTWKNYGMRIPFTGNPSTSSMPGISWITDLGDDAKNAMTKAITSLISTKSDEIASQYVSAGITSMNPSTLTYYDVSMEQPWFHVRSIDSKVSISPGSTVVMGGLITEQRKAMDDKVPFLGDIPFIGRFFRSHAEQTVKRNLLIFVTGRLITPAGREIHTNGVTGDTDEAEVKSAPSAE